MSETTITRRWCSLSQASEYTGLAPRTIRDYVAQGKLKAYRVGPRKISFDIADLDALFEPIPLFMVVMPDEQAKRKPLSGGTEGHS